MLNNGAGLLRVSHRSVLMVAVDLLRRGRGAGVLRQGESRDALVHAFRRISYVT